MASVAMTVGQTVVATATPNGTLASGSVPVWSQSETGVTSITPASDGLSANITALTPGTDTINVDGESSFADGEVHGSGTITITEAAATAFAVTFGTPS